MSAVFYNQNKSGKGFPIGSIIPWSGNSGDIPKGWISCTSGPTLRVQQYPLLYKTIGNTYGGTSGETFKLPRLNDGTSAAMDIFRGHFSYLQDKGDAHKPEKTNILDDVFWQTVGRSLDGNTTSTTQTDWVSSIDIVGQLQNIDDLSATYADLAINSGEYTQVLIPAGRKLSDVHIPSHTHGINITESNSYNAGGNLASDCGYGFSDGVCLAQFSCTQVNRATPVNISGTQMDQMLRGPLESNFYATFDTTLIARGYSYDSLKWGGGAFGPCYGGETSSECYDPTNGADGVSGGDMFSHIGGTKYFWSSLSPSANITAPVNQAKIDEGRRFNKVGDHSHGSLSYTFSSKYLRVVKPALITDVRLNTVRINNDTGKNYGFINVNTATPSLTMQYIIKAY